MQGLFCAPLAAVCLACCAIFNATDSAAATFWSIGSYIDQSNALNEAARIQPALSSEVIIQPPSSANAYYRLLIAAGDTSVKPALERLGIKGFWSVTLNSDSAKGLVHRTISDIGTVTEGQPDRRFALLRGNAQRLLSLSGASV